MNLIHGYADNGDPFIRKFTDQLLEEVQHHSTRDFYDANVHLRRYRSPSSLLCTSGSSPASSLTPSPSSSSPSIPSSHTSSTGNQQMMVLALPVAMEALVALGTMRTSLLNQREG